MNNNDDIIKDVLRKRSCNQCLSQNFSAEVMRTIYASQARKKAMEHHLAIVGYIAAFIVCAATLIYYTSTPLIHAMKDIYSVMADTDEGVNQLIMLLIPVASILLIADLVLRSKVKHNKT